MPRTYRFIALAAVVPFAVACGTQDVPDTGEEDMAPEAQMPAPPPADPMPLTAALTAVGESGITGQVQVSASGEGTSVVVTLNGSTAGAVHQGHIHSGTCETPGARVEDLTAITANDMGTGEATSTVALPLATVANGQHIVMYHAAGGEPGAPVTCAAIPSNM